MADPRKHVVIIGAGFGGLSAAKELAKAPVDVTLIDKQNHHLFQPLLYQVATAALTPAEIAVPIRAVLRDQSNLRVVMDEVCDVETSVRQVICASGAQHQFDALIIATGAQHSYFGNEDWAAHAPGLKTLQDAYQMREKLLFAFEQAELLVKSDPDKARAYQSFVVIGAGPTGVELAGAVSELARSVASDFRALDPAQTRVDTAKYAPNQHALPGVAPVAKQMGAYVGKRLAAEARGKVLRKGFRYNDVGSMATIGRNRAVADLFGLKVTGFIGWLLWGAAHVYFLIGFKNRLFVVLHWLWAYVTWQRGVRLIMHRNPAKPG